MRKSLKKGAWVWKGLNIAWESNEKNRKGRRGTEEEKIFTTLTSENRAKRLNRRRSIEEPIKNG